MKSIIFLIALFSSALSDQLVEIDTLTADCDNCGMTSDLVGRVSLQVCGRADVNPCCVAQQLDNGPFDFQEGQQDQFSGPTGVGSCWLYELGDVQFSDDIGMTMTHSGTDGVTVEWAQVVTNTQEIYRCYFGVELDNSASAVGTDCQRIQ